MNRIVCIVCIITSFLALGAAVGVAAVLGQHLEYHARDIQHAGTLLLASATATVAEMPLPPPESERHERQVDAGERAVDLAASNGWILILFWAHGVDHREDDKARRYYATARNNFFMSMKAMDFFVGP